MNFQKALLIMLKGKMVKSKTIKRSNHIIYLDGDGVLYCETCNKSKGITLDMVKNKNWEVVKNGKRKTRKL